MQSAKRDEEKSSIKHSKTTMQSAKRDEEKSSIKLEDDDAEREAR
jgi:hypothetical protein